MQKVLKTSNSILNLTGWIKLLLCVIAMVVSMILFIGNIQNAMASSLKQDILIEGENITVGDIFNDVYSHKNYVLGPAPEPGEEMVLGAHTLTRIARAFNIAWTPEYAGEQVVLRRSSNIIGQKDATRELVKVLKDAGALGEFEIELDSRNFYVTLPEDAPKTFRIENVHLDKTSKRFTASLIAPAHGLSLNERTVTGSYYNTIKVPVVTKRLRNGDVISKYDIDYIVMKEDDLQPDVITHEQDLIGYTPRRAVLVGTPLKEQELVAPRLINRGERVTINLKSGPISLTAAGKALEVGAKGDLIRVVNLTSNRTIEARVTAAREVVVDTQ